jgi:hypothetical protein
MRRLLELGYQCSRSVQRLIEIINPQEQQQPVAWGRAELASDAREHPTDEGKGARVAPVMRSQPRDCPRRWFSYRSSSSRMAAQRLCKHRALPIDTVRIGPVDHSTGREASSKT